MVHDYDTYNNICIEFLDFVVLNFYLFIIDLNEKDKMYRDFSGNYSVTGNLTSVHCNRSTPFI